MTWIRARATTLTVLDLAAQKGYFQWALDDGTTGWVWSRSVHVIEKNPSSTTGLANVIDPGWNKPMPVSADFSTEGKVCGPMGDGGDTATNLRKNRTDVSDSYHDASF